MAIILPNTRNAIGVPNRYSDLAAAGLRYTPPPVYRYDAYDVQGDTATLYEEDIDLADYQYNTDSYDAAVVPAGYTAVCGGHARWLIGTDTKLYYRDAGLIALPPGSPSNVTRVAYSDGFACLAIVNGALHACWMLGDTLYDNIVDATMTWTEISFFQSPSGTAYWYAIGIADGKIVSYYDYAISVMSHATGWKISGGVMSYNPGTATYISKSSLAIDNSSYLHHVTAGASSAGISDVLELGSDWQEISGYMSSQANKLSYGTITTNTTRMYGIQAGILHSITHQGDNYSPGTPYKTKITEFTDWWRVTFVAPDEAVAIRRIAL